MAYTAKAFSLLHPTAHGPFFFTAEHASNCIPGTLLDSDRQFLHTHWALDIGIAELTALLCDGLSSQGIQAEFSRLWIDANRAHTQEGLIKEDIQGIPLSFNQQLSLSQREYRKAQFHDAYHNAITEALSKHNTPPLLVSMHSFTPIWNGRLREMDIGVLFDRDEDIAHAFAELLRKEGFFVALNQPYSGKNGLIYSADRHGKENNVPYVEFEFNQSILCSQERIEHVAQRMIRVLKTFLRQHEDLLPGDIKP